MLFRSLELLEQVCDRVGRKTPIERTLHTTLILTKSQSQVETVMKKMYEYRKQKGESFHAFDERVRPKIVIGTSSEVLEQIEAYRKLGVSYIVFNIRDLVKLKFAPLELLAKIAGSLG